MNDFVMPLPLPLDVVSLTMGLITIGSVSGDEGGLADSVEQALSTLPHLNVTRTGDTVVARTATGHRERLVIAGHLGTSAPLDNEQAFVEMGRLFGVGGCDVKGGLAALLKTAIALGARSAGPDVTLVLHPGDTLADVPPALLQGDLALLLAPTDLTVQASPEAASHPAVQRLAALSEAPLVTAPTPPAPEGLPTVTFGPGDPTVARTAGEFVPTAQLTQAEWVLREWLRPGPR
ncbi:hypothetical protein [Nocardioides sp.]|uniref:hypothetical protein n=1 Tax=Nocardioides sp. TaxID=35761 RepID=UPI0026296023|nr:hypothetical protein [Nocardioides sp.]